MLGRELGAGPEGPGRHWPSRAAMKAFSLLGENVSISTGVETAG